MCNCESSYKIRDTWVPTSLSGRSDWPIHAVNKFSNTRQIHDWFLYRTLHKIYGFLEAQQEGNKIKHLFRQSELKALFVNCQVGLNQACKIFKAWSIFYCWVNYWAFGARLRLDCKFSTVLMKWRNTQKSFIKSCWTWFHLCQMEQFLMLHLQCVHSLCDQIGQ